MNLFSSENNTPIHLDLPDATVIYYPTFFSEEKANQYFENLLNETNWQQDDINIFGKTHKQPRLTALYGENGKSYTYSGGYHASITLHSAFTRN